MITPYLKKRQSLRMRVFPLAGILFNQPAPEADPAMGNAEELKTWRMIPAQRLQGDSDTASNALQRPDGGPVPLAIVLFFDTCARDFGR